MTDLISSERDTLRLSLVSLLEELEAETLPERMGSYRLVDDSHITQAAAAAEAVLKAVPLRTADGKEIVLGSLVWTRANDSLGLGVVANQWQVSELLLGGLCATAYPPIQHSAYQNVISFRTQTTGHLYSSEEAVRRAGPL